jgi:hypothetical protein
MGREFLKSRVPSLRHIAARVRHGGPTAESKISSAGNSEAFRIRRSGSESFTGR